MDTTVSNKSRANNNLNKPVKKADNIFLTEFIAINFLQLYSKFNFCQSTQRLFLLRFLMV